MTHTHRVRPLILALGTALAASCGGEFDEETSDIVKAGIAAGKSLAELKAAGLPEKFKNFGTGFINTDRWIETLYNDTTKKS